ncbi:MAG: STAS/SEC14 domain-containing protein [Sulfurovum sp.]|nr:STAS/SEC14 domain-containing protein [Sulfurovum sp.]
MLSVKLNEEEALAILYPEGALSKEDFERVSESIDPFIEKSGKLNGILIVVENFPGWDSFEAFSSHIKFVKEHHKKVKAVAFVTDSPLGSVSEHVAKHFVSAKIKHFAYLDFEGAKMWIAQEAKN